MLQRLGKLIVDFWIVLAFGLVMVLVVQPVRAEMIGTETAHAQDERGRVRALVQRPELSQELQKHGLTPGEAVARVDAMSDQEVLQLAGRLDAALAGGQVSNQTLLIIIILVLVLVILI